MIEVDPPYLKPLVQGFSEAVEDYRAAVDCSAFTMGIVVPTLPSRSQDLARCLQSIATQDVGAFEVIVAEDGPATPEVAAVVSSIKLQVPLRHVSAGETAHRGPIAIRMDAHRLTNAPVLGFVDDDCVLEPTWVRTALDALADERIGGVGGPIRSRRSDLFARTMDIFARGIYNQGDARCDTTYLPGGNCAYRAAALEGISVYPVVQARQEHEEFFFGDHVRRRGFRTIYVPDMVVYHDYARDLRHFLRKFYLKGRADRAAEPLLNRVLMPRGSPQSWAAAATLAIGAGALAAISETGLAMSAAAGIVLVPFASSWFHSAGHPTTFATRAVYSVLRPLSILCRWIGYLTVSLGGNRGGMR